MASNQQFSVRVVLAICLTIGVALGAAGTPGKAVAAGGDGSKVAWGDAAASIDAGKIAGVADVFPSKVSAKGTYGTGKPVVYYQTNMDKPITIPASGTTTSKKFIFSLEVKGAAFTGSTSAFHATVEYEGHSDGYICASDLVITTALTDAIVTDSIFNTVCTATISNTAIEVAANKSVGAYFSGTAGFYAQCGMTFNAAMTSDSNDLASSAYIAAADFTGTATPYSCGCTVKSGITHTDGKLKLDVVLKSDARVPHTVFQLARDASEKLLLDTEATAADDYLTTWKAGKVTAKFTTVSAVMSDSVDAALTTADKAADLNATLVSLPTDGAADDLDVATDGSDNKLVKFEITFNKDLCLGNKKVYVNCFLYKAAADNVAVDATVAANYVGKEEPQDFDCETGSDDSGAENSIGFSMFLLMLTALAIEL